LVGVNGPTLRWAASTPFTFACASLRAAKKPTFFFSTAPFKGALTPLGLAANLVDVRAMLTRGSAPRKKGRKARRRRQAPQTQLSREKDWPEDM
jgi:hypothetical protein